MTCDDDTIDEASIGNKLHKLKFFEREKTREKIIFAVVYIYIYIYI